jgi:hypothetical protein
MDKWGAADQYQRSPPSMKILTTCFLIALSGEAVAQEWGKTDTAMLAGALTVSVLDWGQTRDLARRQDHACLTGTTPTETKTTCYSSPVYSEGTNFLLPKHPTTAQVDKSFALGMAATAGLAYVLPQTYRRWFLGGVIVLEAATVVHNHRIGLKVDF